jgi:acylphosphatase
MCQRFIIHGRVQGVFFRASAQEVASGLGLTGWVRNKTDGCVESVACGNQSNMEGYRQWLQEGPRLAKVTKLQEFAEPCTAMQGFDIL